MKKFFLYFFGIIILLVVSLLITGNGHILSGIGQTYFRGLSKPDIDDFDYFEHRKIKAGSCETWEKSQAYNSPNLSEEAAKWAADYNVTAFLVIHKDSILFEKYWAESGPDVPSNSFSMAKSFTSLAIGAAIQNGHIKSVNEPVGNYLPWLKDGLDAELTIEHLLQMRSGINFGESYSNPFGYQAKSYYGADLKDETDDFHVSEKVGEPWWYQGGNTVLLGLIVEEATGMSLGDYFAQEIYSQIGTCADGNWGLDGDGKLEKAFSAFYASPHDFAKVGKLMLQQGEWDEKALISEDYFIKSTTPVGIEDKEGQIVNHYGYQWWLGEIEGYKHIDARGMRGQYIVAVPELDLIMVKLGHDRPDKKEGNMKTDLALYLREAIRMAKQAR